MAHHIMLALLPASAVSPGYPVAIIKIAATASFVVTPLAFSLAMPETTTSSATSRGTVNSQSA